MMSLQYQISKLHTRLPLGAVTAFSRSLVSVATTFDSHVPQQSAQRSFAAGSIRHLAQPAVGISSASTISDAEQASKNAWRELTKNVNKFSRDVDRYWPGETPYAQPNSDSFQSRFSSKLNHPSVTLHSSAGPSHSSTLTSSQPTFLTSPTIRTIQSRAFTKQPAETSSELAWGSFSDRYQQLWGDQNPKVHFTAKSTVSHFTPTSQDTPSSSSSMLHISSSRRTKTFSPPPHPFFGAPVSIRKMITMTAPITARHDQHESTVNVAEQLSKDAWAGFRNRYHELWEPSVEKHAEKSDKASTTESASPPPLRLTSLVQLMSKTCSLGAMASSRQIVTIAHIRHTSTLSGVDGNAGAERLSQDAWGAFIARYRQLWGEGELSPAPPHGVASHLQTPHKDKVKHLINEARFENSAGRVSHFTGRITTQHAASPGNTVLSSSRTFSTISDRTALPEASVAAEGYSIPNLPPPPAVLSTSSEEHNLNEWRATAKWETLSGVSNTAADPSHDPSEVHETHPPELLPPHLRSQGMIVLAGKFDVGYLTFATPGGEPKLLIPLPSSHPTTTAIPLHPNLALSFVSRVIRDEDPRATGLRVWDAVGDEHGRFLRPGNVWAGGATVGDVVKEALSGASKGFFVAVEDEKRPTYVRIPTFEEHVMPLRKQIENLESRLRNLDLIKRECDTLADRTSRNVGWAGFLGLATYFGVTTYLVYGPSNWDVMEPITYLCGIAFGLVAYLWFLITRSEYSYTSLTNAAADSRRAFLYSTKGFDPVAYAGLQERVRRIREEIESIRQDYA